LNLIQIDFWDLAKMSAAVIATLISAAWILTSIIVTQFTRRLDDRFNGQDELRKQREKNLDARFTAIEDAIADEGDGWRKVERELLELKAALPNQYLRREDAIRQEVVIHSKLDALAAKIDALRVGG
jgi:hypothetical protein